MTPGAGGRRRGRAVALVGVTIALSAPGLAAAPDIQAHRAGIWAIAAPDGETRWIVIHDLAEGVRTGTFHVEVLARRSGAPAWDVRHIQPHMAVTKAALERSVLRPLTRGAVYPESFDAAYEAWRAQDDGAGGTVCSTTVTACLASGARAR